MEWSGNIYIVDDDKDDIDFFYEAITAIGTSIHCYHAHNGEEGLQKLRAGIVPIPDCIFLDVNMPRVNGREFLEKIKSDKALKAIPVIMFSTSNQARERESYMKLGATDFIEKPTNMNALKAVIEGVLSKIRK